MAFKMAFIADVAQFLKGSGDVREALGKVTGALDDVGDAGTDSTKQLARDFSEASDKIKADTAAAGRAVGDNISRGTREATEGTRALKENAGANAKEVAASFDGSAQSIVQGFQALGAEAFEGFGPAGMAAGVAAAAGIGLVAKVLSDAKEKAQETAQEVADVASELIDLGSSSLGADQVNDKLKTWASTAEDGKVKLRDLADEATNAGIDFEDYARGLAGDSDAIQRAYAQVTAALAAKDEQQRLSNEEVAQTGRGAYDVFVTGLDHQREAIEAAKKALEEQDGTLNQAADTADLYRQAIEGTAAANQAQADALERSQKAQDSYLSALADAADPVGTYEQLLQQKTDAEQKAAQATADATADTKDTWQQYAKDVNVSIDDLIKDMNTKAAAAADFQANLAKIGAAGGQALADELRAKGPEAAGAIAKVIADADPAKQAELFAAQARAAGESIATNSATGITNSTTSVAKAYQDAIDKAAGSLTAPALPDLTTPSNAAAARPRQNDLTTPANAAATRTSTPATVALSPADREAILSAMARPVQITVPVQIDSRQVALAMRTAMPSRSSANTTGRRIN